VTKITVASDAGHPMVDGLRRWCGHRGTTPTPTNTPERTMTPTTTTDCFDTELSLDELKAITGGVKAAPQTTPAAKAHNTEVAATDDVFVGFGDLYGI